MLSKTPHAKSAWIYTIMIGLVIGADYVALVIMNKIASILPFLGINGDLLLYFTYGALYLVCFPEIVRNLCQKKAVDVLLVSGLFILASMTLFAFFPNNLVGTGADIPKLLLFYLPSYAMVRSIVDYDAISNRMFIVAGVFFAFSIYALGESTSNVLQQGYETHMAIGFQLAFCTLVFADTAFESTNSRFIKIVSSVLTVVAASMVLSIGSRGAMVICLLYILYQLYYRSKRVSIIAKITLTFSILLACAFWNEIRVILISWLEEAIQGSRTLSWLFQVDSSLDSSGRFDIYAQALDAIKQKPFVGYGLYGDRLFLGRAYAHNLFLELMINFGIPVGVIFSATYLLCFFRGLNTNQSQRFISIIGIYATGMLMTSNSYLRHGAFWIALGAILSINKKIRSVYRRR